MTKQIHGFPGMLEFTDTSPVGYPVYINADEIAAVLTVADKPKYCESEIVLKAGLRVRVGESTKVILEARTEALAGPDVENMAKLAGLAKRNHLPPI